MKLHLDILIEEMTYRLQRLEVTKEYDKESVRKTIKLLNEMTSKKPHELSEIKNDSTYTLTYYCNRCGSLLDENYNFCPKCGQAINWYPD